MNLSRHFTLTRILFGQFRYDPRKDLLRVLFSLTNMWMVCNLVLVLAANLPHRPVPWLTWINSSLYLLLFLLTYHIQRQERYNRDIFVLFSVMYLTLASSVVLIFFGKGALVGSPRLAIVAYVEALIVLEFLVILTMVFIAAKYALPRMRPWYVLGISLVLVGGAFVLLLGRGLDPSKIYYATLPRTYRQLFYLNLLGVGAIASYFVTLMRHDWLIGEYITSLMVVYLFRISLDGLSLAGAAFGFRLFEVDQYFLSLTLVMLAWVLFRKLCFVVSPFGQYYEDLLHGQGGLARLKVTRRADAWHFSVLEYARIYLNQRLHAVGIVSVLLVGLVQSLPIGLFLRLNLIAVVLLTVTVYVFFYLLYRRRAKSGFLLPSSKEGA